MQCDHDIRPVFGWLDLRQINRGNPRLRIRGHPHAEDVIKDLSREGRTFPEEVDDDLVRHGNHERNMPEHTPKRQSKSASFATKKSEMNSDIPSIPPTLLGATPPLS